MADQSRAITWALAHASTLRLTIERFGWIEDLMPGWTDVHCTIEAHGQTLHGWGAGATDDLALCKALAEALERAVLLSTNAQNSSGFAAHLTPQGARQNALRELVERDLFLCHFYTRTPLSAFVSQIENCMWLEKSQAWAKQNGLNIQFYHLGNAGAVCAVSGTSIQRPFGFVIGASVKDDTEQSALSALIEAARRSVRYLLRQSSSDALSLSGFLALKHPTFNDHGRLALDLDYASKVASLFAHEPPSNLSHKDLQIPEVKVNDLNWPDQSMQDCPFYFAQAVSSDSQSLFIGEPSVDKINLKRLSRFLGRTLSIRDINPLPHPFD